MSESHPMDLPKTRVTQVTTAISFSTRLLFCFALVALFSSQLAPAAAAQETEPAETSAALARAAKIMKKIDTDGNGSFEKSEGVGVWRRYRKLDLNEDQVISLEELAKQQPEYLEAPGGRKVDLVYKTVGQKKLALDLYFPTNLTRKVNDRFPVVIYTHGGGWAAGSKHGITKGLFQPVFLELLEQGFAVASVNYRLCNKDGSVKMRDCVVDCKDAVRWLSLNGQTHGLDSDRFLIIGDSAGGHLAQMLLLTSPESFPGSDELADASYTILAGVSWYGPCDFENIDLFNHDDRPDFTDRFRGRILGAEPNEANKLELYREMSPVNYLRATSPPLLMIQGDKDTTIPVKHAYRMKQKSEEIGATVETMIVRNSGHNWRKVDEEIEPSREAIGERTVQFLVEQLED